MAERKRLLNNLKVIELRAELEKRNLDKTGVRNDLIARLTKHLQDEGHDPATYRFDQSTPETPPPTKRTRRSESAVEPETEDTPAIEDMLVQDDAGEEDESEEVKAQGIDEPTDTIPDQMEVEEIEKVSLKRDINDASEATEAKKPCLEKDDDLKAETNTDAEDSINLDLGEDELLNEETENTTKPKKDDGGFEDTGESACDGTPADTHAEGSDPAPADEPQVNADASATSTDDDKKDESSKGDKEKEDGEKKEKKEDGKEGGARNLWVSGLSGDTRAKDLKQLCSKHGKVIGAKVVTNARNPSSRCYGYVTMGSPQDAENCIKNLHRTELHGRMISVEKAKSESDSSSRRQARFDRRSRDRKEDAKENEARDKEGEKDSKKKDGDASGAESHRSTSRSREKSHRSDKDRAKRSTRSREKRRSPKDVLSFSKIWKERDIVRARERSRAVREEERRRRAAEDALRDRERRQRQEKHRLALEREKLRAEREKIEREKNELLRLERERHRLEREKLELERLELKRAQLRLEEERRKRGYESGAAYRKPVASPPLEPYERDRHKRPPPPPMSSSRGQFDAPPPPRFDMTSNYDRGADKRDRDYKRDYPRHVSTGNVKYPSNGNSNDDNRAAIPAIARPKDVVRSYESRDGRSYRPSPPGKPDPRNWNATARYTDGAPPSKGNPNSGGNNEPWVNNEPRYGGGGGTYEPRYPPTYQPPPPGASYPDRYAPPGRDYRKY